MARMAQRSRMAETAEMATKAGVTKMATKGQNG